MINQLKAANAFVVAATEKLTAAEVLLNEADILFDNQLLVLDNHVKTATGERFRFKVEFTTVSQKQFFAQDEKNMLYIFVRRIDERFEEVHPCCESCRSIPLDVNELKHIEFLMNELQSLGLILEDDAYSDGNTNVYKVSLGE